MNKNSFYPLGQLHHLKDACIEVKNGKEYWYTQKTLIECCNTIDEAIATAIIDIAKRNNFNDCLLLNEENILNLLRKAHYFDEELKRKEMIILQQKKRIDDLEKLISKVEKENKILSQNADTAFQDGLNEAQDLYSKQIAKQIFEDIEKTISSMEYKANTPRKTVKVEELKEQVNWVLHKVIPDTINKIKDKYTGEPK